MNTMSGYEKALSKLVQAGEVTGRGALLSSLGSASSCSVRRVPCLDPERWAPAGPDGTVTAMLHSWRNTSGVVTLIKLSFWGEDDTGFERYVRPDPATSLKTQAAEMDCELDRWTRWVSNLSLVSFDLLRAMGLELG